jgi:hypothetical protein
LAGKWLKMALNTEDRDRIREYLLGQLSDDEQQKIEERLMVEVDLFEEFEISKGELVEEYCAGELGQSEQEWFERNYLASAEGTNRHRLALALDSLSRPSVAPESENANWLERLRNFFKRQPWSVAAIASATAGVVIAGALWLSRVGPPQTDVYLTLSHSAPNREEGTLPQKTTLPSNTRDLKARLLLPQPAEPGVRYRAVLDDQTKETTVRVTEQSGDSVTVAIPREQLPPGEYALDLYMIKPDGTEQAMAGSYFFNVY